MSNQSQCEKTLVNDINAQIAALKEENAKLTELLASMTRKNAQLITQNTSLTEDNAKLAKQAATIDKLTERLRAADEQGKDYQAEIAALLSHDRISDDEEKSILRRTVRWREGDIKELTKRLLEANKLLDAALSAREMDKS